MTRKQDKPISGELEEKNPQENKQNGSESFFVLRKFDKVYAIIKIFF